MGRASNRIMGQFVRLGLTKGLLTHLRP